MCAEFDDQPRSRYRRQPLGDAQMDMPGARNAGPRLWPNQRVQRRVSEHREAATGIGATLPAWS
jgi:hypothetical protein